MPRNYATVIVAPAARVYDMENMVDEWRKELGLTWDEYADRVGVHYATLRRWLTAPELSLDRYNRLCDAGHKPRGFLLEPITGNYKKTPEVIEAIKAWEKDTK